MGNSFFSIPWDDQVHRTERRHGFQSEQIQALALHGLWSQDQEHRLRDDKQGRAVTVSLESTPSFGHQDPGLEAGALSSPFFPRPLSPTGALWEKASVHSYTASWGAKGETSTNECRRDNEWWHLRPLVASNGIFHGKKKTLKKV